MTQTRKLLLIVATLTSLLGGCMTKVTVVGADGGVGSDPATPAADGGVTRPSSCTRGGDCSVIDVSRVDKLDLLLVVDNSASMAAEQAALATAMSPLMEALSRRAKDFHFGVISSDLGLSGVDGVAQCSSVDGDGARLQHDPHGMSCDAAYPLFLSFNGDQPAGPLTDRVKFADDMACVAPLGTMGCGYRQPLEAALKAVWPAIYTDAAGHVVDPNPVQFLSISQSGALGLGDIPQAQGGNLGFLRSNPALGPALLSIVVVSSGEDCSMSTSAPFQAGDADPDTNLRCFHNPDALLDVNRRYGQALPLLHPDRPDLVTFGAIVGVPVDDVDDAARAAVDMHDAMQRNAYYDKMLDDPRMQQTVDPSTGVGRGTGNLTPSCKRSGADGSVHTAFPPRRIVEVAKSLGDNGVVQSICQDDLTPALQPITDSMLEHLGEQCLAFELKRDEHGSVACDVIWQLPSGAQLGSGTPTACDDEPFLTRVSGARKTKNDRGGNNCVVKQLMTADLTVESGEGWYYDDFSFDTANQCQLGKLRRIAFSAAAKPTIDVQVVLDCDASAS